MPWYHLVFRQRTSHTAPFSAGRKFHQGLGISSSPQKPSAFAEATLGNEEKTTYWRFNGRTRDCLNIDSPTPRPCSAVFFVPISTK